VIEPTRGAKEATVAIAAIRTSATVDELVEAVANEVSRSLLDVADAVDLISGDRYPDPEALDALWRRGLIHITHDYLAGLRRANEEHLEALRRRFMMRTPHGRALRRDLLERWPLTGADGYKTLSQFTIPDCDAYIGRAMGEIAGWNAKSDVISKAKGLLIQRQVPTIGQLPDTDRATLTLLVEEAWS
jgi:hypothetical protein